MDVVFYRGMTMQCAVPRNEQGESDYAMMAVNPLRVSPWMTEGVLKAINTQILKSNDNKGLLEASAIQSGIRIELPFTIFL